MLRTADSPPRAELRWSPRRRKQWALLLSSLVVSLTGCRCSPLFEPYSAAIDHIKDYPVLFDKFYTPRLDISRAGKPDWCGPINSTLGPCRCCDQSEWKRYDECWLYPPRTPYMFPGASFPGPTQISDPNQPAELDDHLLLSPLLPTTPPPPEPKPPE